MAVGCFNAGWYTWAGEYYLYPVCAIAIAVALPIIFLVGPVPTPPLTQTRLRQAMNAQDRSLLLLREWLNPEQLRDFEHQSQFKVKGSDGCWYTIQCIGSTSGNVIRHSKVTQGQVMCCIPNYDYCLPLYDIYLAQALKIAFDARGFCAKAIVVGRRNYF